MRFQNYIKRLIKFTLKKQNKIFSKRYIAKQKRRIRLFYDNEFSTYVIVCRVHRGYLLVIVGTFSLYCSRLARLSSSRCRLSTYLLVEVEPVSVLQEAGETFIEQVQAQYAVDALVAMATAAIGTQHLLISTILFFWNKLTSETIDYHNTGQITMR